MKKSNLIFILIITLLVLFSSTSITYGAVYWAEFWERMNKYDASDPKRGGAKVMLGLSARTIALGTSAEDDPYLGTKQELAYKNRTYWSSTLGDTGFPVNRTTFVIYVYQSILPTLNFTSFDAGDIYNSVYDPGKTNCTYFYAPLGKGDHKMKDQAKGGYTGDANTKCLRPGDIIMNADAFKVIGIGGLSTVHDMWIYIGPRRHR